MMLKEKLLAAIILVELCILAYLAKEATKVRILPTGKTVKVLKVVDWKTTHCDVTRRLSKDKDLYVELIPNKHVICRRDSKTIEIKINSLGFRDREFTLNKSRDTIRILTLGDSFTYGWGVSQEDTWPKVLEKLSRKEFSNKKIEVLNLGIPGYDIWNVANLISKRVIKFDYDILLISFIENDVVPEKSILGKSESEIFQRYLGNSTHRKNYIEKSFSVIRKVSNRTVMIVLWPFFYEGDVIELAKKYNFLVCSVKSVYLGNDYRKLILDDGHPNEYAYHLIAEKVLDCIKNSI